MGISHPFAAQAASNRSARSPRPHTLVDPMLLRGHSAAEDLLTDAAAYRRRHEAEQFSQLDAADVGGVAAVVHAQIEAGGLEGVDEPEPLPPPTGRPPPPGPPPAKKVARGVSL